MQITCVLLLLCLINSCYCIIYKLNDEEYRLMPPVVHLDPYETCMYSPEALYCTAYMSYVSDEPSELLTQMQEYSKHKTTHFNHTRVIYGACMTDICKEYNITTDLKLSLEACLNKTQYEEYKLKVLVEEVSCVGCHEEMKIGPAFIVVAAICGALVILNLIGSLYDVLCKCETGMVAELFLCFSVFRNWQRLVAVPGERDPAQKMFKCFYGIRAFLMTLVLSAHGMLPLFLLSDQTKFFEELYEVTWLHIFLNGTVIMQMFLQLSAMLLVYNGLRISEKQPLTWTMLPLGIVKRWLRLTPSYGLVLGVTATWQQYIGTGPLWDKIVITESRDCQRDWWKHILYINNYFDGSHCMPQTWYLAVDTQLYVLGLIVFVICKTPMTKKVVLSFLFLLGLVIPGVHTYFQDLDGTLIVSPTAANGFFVSDPTFNKVYKRGHTNIACYVLALAFGYLLYHLRDANIDVSKYKRWRPFYWAVFPAIFSILLLCKINYMEGPRASLAARVAMACFIKPIFGFGTLILVAGIIFKIENLYRGVLEWRGWTCIGRISYSAYLLHIAFIRAMAGSQTSNITGTYTRMAEMVLLTVVVTYTSAFIFYITVETPLGELSKTLLNPKKPEKADAKVENNDCVSRL